MQTWTKFCLLIIVLMISMCKRYGYDSMSQSRSKTMDNKMLKHLREDFLLLIIFYSCVYGDARHRNRFVYEKEISEHCQRRVIPSVFLGRQVMDAYSQVLYFSKVDLPYTCYISVRAESGSNIILVVQLLSAQDLIKSCAADPNQLLVYELGETFGGYWGPSMPQSFHNGDNNSSTMAGIYSLKHTEETTTESDSEEIVTASESTKGTDDGRREYVEAPRYRTMEITLLNLTGHFVPGVEDQENSFEDSSFDLLYDVMPRQNVRYQTTLMPILQFSLQKEDDDIADFDHDFQIQDKRMKDEQAQEHREDNQPKSIEHNNPDYSKHSDGQREIMDEHSLKEDSDVAPKEDKELKGSKEHVDDKGWASIEELLGEANKSGSLTTVTNEELDREVSVLIEKLIGLDHNESAYLLGSDDLTDTTTKTETTTEAMTETMLTQRLNFLLHSSLSDDSELTEQSTTGGIENHDAQEIGKALENYNFGTQSVIPILTVKETTEYDSFEFIDEDTDTYNMTESSMLESMGTDISYNITVTTEIMDEIIKESNINATETTEMQNVTIPDTSTSKTSVVESTASKHKSINATPGALLDHESWENLVRAAPDMAVRLDEKAPQKIIEAMERNTMHTNISQQTNPTETPLAKSTTSKVTMPRKKRFIHGIMIEDSKPHNLTTKEEMSTTTSSSIYVSDVQMFAQLVELVDDDMHERAALRYLSQYVGNPIFNLCEYEQPKARYVHLFNSSRLVIALGNFTLRSMQLVITPARKLYTGKSRCPPSNLECQVAGNRVCIDAMSACDGVANCGEPDIYDEDRLMCGAYMGLRHNVCLAAVTFLAVLLTLIYMVHYWLRRCVPKVSEAFFIYTEGDENILYLDTIMRSPNDADVVVTKSLDMFDGDALFMSTNQKVSKIQSCMKKLIPCLFKKQKRPKIMTEEWDQINLSSSNILFPYSDLGEKTIYEPKDASVQTGESLEMKYLKNLNIKAKNKEEHNDDALKQPDSDSSRTLSYEQQKLRDELTLMKYLKRARNDTIIAHSSHTKLDGRKELFKPTENTEDRSYSDEIEIRHYSYDENYQRDQNRTRGKNNEFATDVDVHTEEPKSMKTKHLRFNEDVVNIPRNEEDSDEEISALQYDEQDFDSIEDTEHSAPSTSIDFKRFWGGKSKKPKKKTQTLPR